MDYDFQFNNQSENNGMPPVDLGTPEKNGRTMAISSLILAAVSIFLLFMGCCCINLIPAILAVVFAAISKKRDGKMSGIAIAGLVIGIISIVLTVILLVMVIYIGVQISNNPTGEIARAMDQAFLQRYGVTFQEYLDQFMQQ